ncbi:MAG: GAF domain-containing protein [Acidobacteria bacterium]|nr:GAF domain-containing protein [Acidobacteriota bacterium]
MVQFDNQYRQIKIKIVYYGPALSGKTTCLQQIHRRIDPDQKTKLYSFNTANDRTLFFDLLAFDLGRIRGYRLALQLYTVPGQVQYNATRRAVLTGTDGIVFVSDSQASERQANIESVKNMWANLEANGIDRTRVPIVYQHNKRDLPNLLSIETLNDLLNPFRAPSFPSVAVRGEGVMKGFAAITEQTLVAVAGKLGVGTSPQALDQLRLHVRAAMEPFLAAPPEIEVDSEPEREVVEPASSQAEGPLSDEDLVQEAVRANVAMTDLNTRLDQLRRQLERKVRVLAGIASFGRNLGVEQDPNAVLTRLVETAAELLEVPVASVLLVPPTGGLEEFSVRGEERDPLMGAVSDTGEPLATELAGTGDSRLIVSELQGAGDGGDRLLAAVEEAGYNSAVVVPLAGRKGLLGLLTAYGHPSKSPLGESDLQLAEVLASTASVAYTNAIAWRELQKLNEGLEAQVAARTRDLEASLAEVQRLNAELETANEELKRAYGQLAELDRVKSELTIRIADDLKGPVRSVVTAAQLLTDMAADLPERAGRYGTIISEKARELTEIMENVMQASLLAAAGKSMATRSVSIRDLLKETLAPLRERAKSRDVHVQVLIASGLETVTCAPDLFSAALRSVVKNAIDYNRKGGEAKIEVRHVDQGGTRMIAFRISDTGIGIPKDDQPRVFEAFWRGSSHPEEAGPAGAGLGLAVAKRVVESHGGTIFLESIEGEGTTVTIVLPDESA